MKDASYQASWPVVPLGRLLRSREEFGEDLQLLSLSARLGVRERPEGEGRAASDDLSGYRVVRAGDFVVNRLVAKDGAFAVSRLNGLISPAYWVLRPAVEGLLLTWVNYVLQSHEYLHELGRLSKFMPPAQFDLGWDQFKSLQVPVPDLRTQLTIVDFLDRELAEMDAVKSQLQRIRAVLSERLDVVLSNVFSGATGRHCRLKDLLQAPISYGVLVPRLQDDGGVRFIRSGDLVDLPSRSDGMVHIPSSQSAEYRRTVVAPGDLLVCVVGASVGVSAVVPRELAGANVARAVARVQLAKDIPVQLILAWTRSWNYRAQVQLSTGGDTAQPTLNVGDLKNFELTLPTDLSAAEAEIKDHLRDYTNATTAVDRQLALLAERRQVLITEAVTGKLDLFGVAS